METGIEANSTKTGLFNRLMIFFIRLYKKALSPCLPTSCRFEPTCSVYALECFARFGFLRAFLYMVKRILRCHPFCEGGFDPVPSSNRVVEKYHPTGSCPRSVFSLGERENNTFTGHP